ncbi:single-stranded DNA-binding protein [Pseudomonas putida]|uniref:Single-stranded DNA-binding protein n=1 Tax=Pseudomonas putida TaxID=303 RepID=A0A8I1ECW2_PSEPU|nr:single-stranded DNA-binding protein [Pseudomonas putida]MBI6883037.1 single-stranded DNA-binding protein [Pseudomonas putida]
MNKTFLGGMVVKPGQINKVSDTQDVVNFTLLTSQSYTDKDGKQQEQTQFHECSYFFASGKAENIVKLLTKGRVLELEGKLKTSKPRPGKNQAGEEKTYVNKGVIVQRILKFGVKDASKGGAQQDAA